MNGDKNKNIYSSQKNTENIPLAENLEKDAEFIRIKRELFKKSPKVIAWDKETGLHSEYVAKDKKNYLEARRIFSIQYPNRYQSYLEIEKGFPSKIKTDSEYREQRLEKLVQNISEKTDKNELTDEESEELIDELPTSEEREIQQDFLHKRPEVAQRHDVKILEEVGEAVKTRLEKVSPQPEYPTSQPIVEDEQEKEKRDSDFTKKPREYAERKIKKTVEKRIKDKAEVTKPSRAGRRILRSTRESFKKGASRFGKTASRKTVQVAARLGRAAVQAGSRALATIPAAFAETGGAILAAIGIAMLIITYFIALIGLLIAQTIIYIIFLVVTIVFILFIINSGAYIVPPHNPLTGGGTDWNGYGSCPIPGGDILCGSYPDCHGTNDYWDYQSSDCSWPLPVQEGNRCLTNSYSGNVCYSPSSTCSEYGWATDAVYPGYTCGSSAPVYFSHINSQELYWRRTSSYSGTLGENGIYIASDGANVYEMYFVHLENMVDAGNSGQRIGDVWCGLDTPHVHFELKINGSSVMPDFLCSGDEGELPEGLVDCDAPGPYPPDYVPDDLVSFTDPASGREIQISDSADGPLADLLSRVDLINQTLSVYYGYRSYAQQLSMCETCNAAKLEDPTTYCLVAPAQFSQHRTGRAVDLYNWRNGSIDFTNSISPQQESIAGQEGFTHPWPAADPPHFYYVP